MYPSDTRQQTILCLLLLMFQLDDEDGDDDAVLFTSCVVTHFHETDATFLLLEVSCYKATYQKKKVFNKYFQWLRFRK